MGHHVTPIFFKMLVRKLRLDNRTIYSIHPFTANRTLSNMLLILLMSFDYIIICFSFLLLAAFKCEASY